MNNIFLPKKASKHQFPYEEMVLKESHEDSPIWINYDALIIFETFKCNSKQAADFLIAIAEPISRPKYIHEYQITAYSLYAAVSVGLSTDDIISTLSFFSKNVMPKSVKNFIIECTLSYGKIKLVIQFNKYFIEAVNKNILNMLCEDEIIRKNVNVIDLNATENVKSYEVLNVEVVKKRSIEIDYPLIEEYDFRNDKVLSSLNIDLKPTTIIRSYQETCLNKMFCNGRARSGIIVLPCGSGKTLVGITALTTIKKSCLILCTSAVSVEQWRQQTIFFTNISPDNIVRFTSDHKEWFKDKSGILVTTYTMLAYTGRRSYEAQKIMDSIQTTEWGLLLLDEVHVVPAQMFRKVISLVTHHCKLGLTATLVREDDKIEDLNFLIGPKLYEADWQDLSQQGHIAKVECSEVWCNMTSEFYKEYLAQPSRKRRLLSIMNPTKFQVCEYLINRHEAKGDKIIVFSDSVAALKAYALRLGKPYIYGPTGQTERMRILKQFQTNPLINTIFLSKVGDTSIDLPEATCLIQISSHFGSRRQEAQRLGRILRAKRRNDPDFKVFFYSLVSKDTDEMFYSTKRQQFLVDQGYTFNIVTEISELLKNEERVYKTKGQQRELLASVLLASEKELESEDSNNQDEITSLKQDIRSMTGVGNMAYVETNKPSIAHKKKKKNN